MKVIKFYPRDAAQNPDAVLEQSIGVYDEAVIIGHNKDGELEVRSSTNWTTAEILFALESFKVRMLNGDYCA